MTLQLKGGLVLGKWKLGKPLGSGGQGEVWEARPVSGAPGPPRALKVCLATEARQRDRFTREVGLLRGLPTNGHVIPIIDAEVEWTEEPKTKLAYSFYVTERFESSLLGLRWIQRAPLHVLTLFLELCDAVEFLHTQSPALIHRDIKPSNIFLGSEPYRLALGDLGIAFEQGNQDDLTATHEVVGSRHYRAPETLMGGKGDPRSDIYSLGRTLEWLLTGRDPDLPKPREIPASLRIGPATRSLLDTVLRTACAPDAAARYQSVAQLKAALPAFQVDIAGVIPSPLHEKGAPLTLLDAAGAYAQTKSILERRDVVAWREVEKAQRGNAQSAMSAWRSRQERKVPQTWEGWAIAFDELLVDLAPVVAPMLACAEFPSIAMGDPLQILRDVLRVAEWNPSGLTVLVEAPLSCAFAVHHLVGGVAASVGNDQLIADVAALQMPRDGSRILLREHSITSWPGILDGKATEAWRYLTRLPDKMPWVLALFGKQLDYVVSLMAYRWQLAFIDFAHATTSGSNVSAWAYTNIPAVIFQESTDALERSYVLAFPSRARLEATCSRCGIPVQHAREHWPKWVAQTRNAAKSSLPNAWFTLDLWPLPDLPG